MTKILFSALAVTFLLTTPLLAQEDNTELALEVSKANETNIEKLKDYIWKLKLDGYVNKELKLTTLSEMKFDKDGKLVSTPIDASTTVKAKPGIRGRMQQSAAEDNLDYVEHAAATMLNYAYMTKGELVDFFDKATVIEENDELVATAKNVKQEGDEVIIHIDPTTYFFKRKVIKAKSGADPIECTVDYATFASTGVNHVDKSYLMMPAKDMQVNTENIDYTQRVE